MKKTLYTMYGAEFSLYSGKLRSYLRKKAIPFREVHPSVFTYKRFIKPRTGVTYIPVLQTPHDEVLQDTTVIIDHLEAQFPDNPVYPNSPQQKLASLLLELFGDEWLLLPAMHYRWHYGAENHDFIYTEFGRLMYPWMPRRFQLSLGKKVGDRFRNFVPRLGITDATWQALETWFEQLLSDLEKHFEIQPYLLGGQPTIADFGFIGPFYAHLFRDPYSGSLIREKAPGVQQWVERMMSDDALETGLSGNYAIAPTLLPVLQQITLEQLPVLLDTAVRLDYWAEGKTSVEVPRNIGEHLVFINGVSEKRAVIPYSLWMFQRPLDYYHGLTGSDREAANSLLDTMGARSFFENPLKTRLKRVANRVYLDR